MKLKSLETSHGVSNKKLLAQFCSFLDNITGLYYPKERWNELEKKLVPISNAFGFNDTESCLEWLMKNPINKKQLNVLSSHLTIGETYFFRDQQLYSTLEQQIIPDIIQRRLKEQSIRIWSVACCSGEEPYSLAILLHRIIPNIKEWKISILASDINPEFLLKAEKGRYKKWSFRTTPPDIIEHYFKKNKDDTFSLIPEIKNTVEFTQLNLVDNVYPNPIKNLDEMDLILCHNVLIYFSENQTQTTLHKLTNCLANNGWLSVSAIEVPFVSEKNLNPHRYPGTVFFKKEPNTRRAMDLPRLPTPPAIQRKSPPLKPAPITSKRPIKEKKIDSLLEKCTRLTQQKEYEEAISLLEPHLFPIKNDAAAIKEHIKEVLLLIRTYANQGDPTPALGWIDKAIQADQLNPTLHYLHATLLQEQGNHIEAIRSAKNTLFIEPDFVMAYILLGILEQQQGNKKAALRNFKTASNLIDNLPSEKLLPHTEGVSIESLKDLVSNNLKTL